MPGELIPFKEIAHVFETFEHTAWRLETRRGYATDRNSEAWSRWKAGQDVAHDPPNAWRRNVAEQTGLGKRFARCGSSTSGAPRGRPSSWPGRPATWRPVTRSAACSAGTRTGSACPTPTSGSSPPAPC